MPCGPACPCPHCVRAPPSPAAQREGDGPGPAPRAPQGPRGPAEWGILHDRQLAQSWVFLFFFAVYWPLRVLHRVSFAGLGRLPRNRGCLLIAKHSTHNMDVLTIHTAWAAHTGRFVRCLVHRGVFRWAPFVRWLGFAPGTRREAVRLLRAGLHVACIPGGVREALQGPGDAYRLKWEGREGFAHIAWEAQCDVYPVHVVNQEEMAFQVVFWVCHVLRLGVVHAALGRALPARWRRALEGLVHFAWYMATHWLCFLAVPVPVPIALVVGERVPREAAGSPSELAQLCHDALQRLILQHQPGFARDFGTALRRSWRCRGGG